VVAVLDVLHPLKVYPLLVAVGRVIDSVVSVVPQTAYTVFAEVYVFVLAKAVVAVLLSAQPLKL
jgi:hypothetical protein